MDTNIKRYTQSLRSQNRTAETITYYLSSINELEQYLKTPPRCLHILQATHEDIEDFFSQLLTRPNKRTGRPLKPGTTANIYRAVKSFYTWCTVRNLIKNSPMQHTHPPRVPEQPPKIIATTSLKKLLRNCNKKKCFYASRDLAIIRILLCNGIRRTEIAQLTTSSIDLNEKTLTIVRKGKKRQTVPITNKTAQALTNYLEHRAHHPLSYLPNLWLGKKGPMTGSGIYYALGARARKLGIHNIHPHRFRHTFAHNWLAAGGNESDVMAIAGWTTRNSMDRYIKSTALERAIGNYRKLQPNDNI